MVLSMLFVVPCSGMDKTTDAPYFELIVKALEVAQRESYKSSDIDWISLKNDVLKRYAASSNKNDAFAAIKLLIERINDDHSFLSVNGARFDAADEFERMPKSKEQLAIRSSLSKEKIAYIHVPRTVSNDREGMKKYAKALYTEIAKYSNKNISAFILDFRNNSGGQLWPMLAGLSALIDSDNAGIGVFADGPRWNWWARGGKAGTSGKNFKNVNHSINGASFVDFDDDLPIAVLISGTTGSSGEASVMSFIGSDKSCLIGQRSRAQATINQPFELDETTKIFIARGYFGNRDGGIYPTGISPNIKVDDSKGENSIEIARDWITGNRTCG